MLQLACLAAAPGRVGHLGRPRTHTGTRNNPLHKKNLHYPVQCNIYTKNSTHILSYKTYKKVIKLLINVSTVLYLRQKKNKQPYFYSCMINYCRVNLSAVYYIVSLNCVTEDQIQYLHALCYFFNVTPANVLLPLDRGLTREY